MSTTGPTVTAEIFGRPVEATVLDEVWVPSYDDQSAHDVRVDVDGTTFVVDAEDIETETDMAR